MGRKASKPPSEIFMVRFTYDNGGQWWEGPYATHAAAKARKTYWSGRGYGRSHLKGYITKATVSEWEEI